MAEKQHPSNSNILSISQIGYLSIIILLITCFSVTSSYAQSTQYQFEQIETKNGVYLGGVNSIFQDSFGYVWVSCSEGLFQYNGENFKHYNSSSKNYHIPFEWVQAIKGRKAGELILNNGISVGVFNYLDQSFDTIYYQRPERKGRLFYAGQTLDASGTLWMQRQIKNNSQSYDHFLYNSKDFKSFEIVYTFHTTYDTRIEVGKEGVLVSIDGAVIEVDQHGKTISRYEFPDKSPYSPQVDANGALWVKDACSQSPTPESCGIHFWDEETGAFKEINIALGNEFGPSKFMWMDDDYIFSTGTWVDSLFLYNRESETLLRFGKEEFGGFSFWTSCLLKDQSGNYWLGGSDLVKMEARPNIVHYLKNGNENCIQNICNIKGIKEAPTGEIYISYERSISILNPKNNSLRQFHQPLKDKLEAMSINFFNEKIVLDNYLFDPENKKGKIINATSIIRSISLTDKSGRLWVCTNENTDLFIFKNVEEAPIKLNSLKPFLEDFNPIEYNDILQSKDGTIWIVTGKHGIFHLNNKGDIIKHYLFNKSKQHSLLSKINYAIAEDEGGNIWIGSSMGLSKLSPQEEHFQHFTTEDGLQGTRVYCMVIQPSKGLWLGTGTGISFFDFGTSSFVNFTQKDGLMNKEYNRKSAILSSTGRLYFGGLNGVDAFYPNELLSKNLKTDLPIILTHLTFFDGEKNETVVKKSGLENIKEINLKAADKYFELGFRLADFRTSTTTQYSFMLKGYDNWSVPEERNELRYENLPPGNYILRVKAAVSPGVWNNKEIAIPIIKQEYWYKTKTAFFSFITLFLLATYYFYQNQLKRKLEQEEALRLRELDTVKTRLYTNITHEFRTPLTVILGMIDNIRGHRQERSLIKRNSKNLLRLINQLLDLSKLDSGTMKMDAVQDDVINYLRYLTESFYSMAQERKINLQFTSAIDELVMDFDEVKLQHVVYNLLSNALKFTPEGGTVLFQTDRTTRNGKAVLHMKLKDTGVGIPADKLPHIFDRFYQADNSNTRKGEGTGIGLSLTHELVQLMGGIINVKSEEGVGSTFSIWLPILNTAPAGKLPEEVARRKELEKELIPDTLTEKADRKKENGIAQNGDLPILLIIEDNKDVAHYIRSILEESYIIHWSKDGEAGIEKALEIVPDIIISDVMMPKKDGFEVTNFLKNDERTSHIPIILLTAKADVDSRLEGLERGADAYLAKPFNKKELKVRLDKLVELRQTLQARYAQTPIPQPTPNKSLQIEDAFLKRMNDIIEANLDNAEFSVVDFSQEAGMSQSQLLRKLKALTGKSAVAYLRSVRLHRAKEMLSKGELNVSEVAYEVGFSDPLYFSRAFSKEFGFPPTDVSS